VIDLEDEFPDRPTERFKRREGRNGTLAASAAGGQKGANTMAMKFRKAPITLPAISIQKRDEA